MLAKAPAHPTSLQADPPLSRASPLPQKIADAHSTWIQHQTLWERACSRRRQHIQHHRKQTHRYREQARSHKDCRCPQHLNSTPNPVGAGLLAKASAHPTSPQADPPLSRASSLPQWIASAHSIRIQHQTLQQLLKHWRESAPSRCPRWPSCVVRCLRWCGSSLPGHRASRAGR